MASFLCEKHVETVAPSPYRHTLARYRTVVVYATAGVGCLSASVSSTSGTSDAPFESACAAMVRVYRGESDFKKWAGRPGA